MKKYLSILIILLSLHQLSYSQCSPTFTYNIDPSMCTVNFELNGVTNYYTGTSTFFYIDYGDGTGYAYHKNYTGQLNTTHVYDNGTYTAQIQLESSSCVDTTLSVTFNVNCQPAGSCDASFTQSPITCDSIEFSANVNSPNYDYSWIIMDGQHQANLAVVDSYIYDDTTTAYLMIIDSANGCADFSYQDVILNCPCNITGDINYTLDTTNCQVNFNLVNITGGSGTYYNYSPSNWNVNPGIFTSSGFMSASVSYNQNGTFSVQAIVSDSQGCTETLSDSVTVDCMPYCNSQMSVDLDTTNCLYTFNLDYGNADTIILDFGDGSVDTLVGNSFQSVYHTYPTNGTYNAQAHFSGGFCDTIIYETIQTNCMLQSCNLDFNTTYISCNTVNVSPTVASSNYTYYWDFGTLGTYSGANPPNLNFNQNGTYPLTLYVSGSSPNCSDTITHNINVVCNSPCNASFNYAVDTNLCVLNYDITFGQSNSVTVDFGDGTTKTYQSYNYPPTYSFNHVYALNGSYTINVHYQGNACDTIISYPVAINCQGSNPCNASFSYQPITCDSLLFYPDNYDPNVTYTWYSTSNNWTLYDTDTMDMYVNDTSEMTLTVIDSVNGCSATSTQLIVTNCPCNITADINWTLVDSNSCEYEFNVTNIAGGSGSYYVNGWTYPGGSLVYNSPLTVGYPVDSLYPISVTIFDSQQCQSTILDTINVNCYAISTGSLNPPLNAQVQSGIYASVNEDQIKYLIYPNPTKDMFTIELEGEFKYELFDYTGNLIKRNQGFDKKHIDIKGLSDGIYLLLLKKDDQLIYEKVVKK